MTQAIRQFGLASLAIAAIGLVGAAGAQATQVHALSAFPISLFSQQTVEHVWTTDAGTIRCSQAASEATAPASGGQQATFDHLTVTYSYTGCVAYGQAATIDMNGCKYTYTSKDTVGKTYLGKTMVIDITGCTAGKQIEITTGICRMTMPEQHHRAHKVWSNLAGADVTLNITLAGSRYQADGPLCPNMPSGQTKENGTYTGESTVVGRIDTGSEQATHNGHQFQKLLQTGAEVDLTVT